MASEDITNLAEKSSLHIIAAIDFGTSRSAVSFTFVDKDDVADPKDIIPTVIGQYPKPSGNLSGQTVEKVPTEVSYEDAEVKCALAIKPQQSRLRWFKLALDPEAVRESNFGNKFPEYIEAMVMGKDVAREATIDYLTFLRRHFDNMIDRQYGETVGKTTPRSFVLTVPAIWSQAGQNLTRDCALAAGLGHNVVLVSEPEAAVIYSLSVILPQRLTVGDKFVVVDAGGGTVDLISYIVEGLGDKIDVKEIVAGAGKVAGGIAVDKAFSAFMHRRFSGLAKWTENKANAAVKYFEEHAKVDFDGDDEDGILIPLPGIDDAPFLEVEDGYATLSADEVKSLFAPAVKEVLKVLDEQCNALQDKPRAILMVGGFGQSPYLVKCVKEHVGQDIEVLQPVNAQTAVARGAVLKGVAEFDPRQSLIAITSRVARRAYGLHIATKFQPGHDETKIFRDPFHGDDRIRVIKPVIVKGQQVTERDAVIFNLHSRRPITQGPFETDTITIWAHDDCSLRTSHMYKRQGWYPLAQIPVDLTPISASNYGIARGQDGIEYFVIHYEIKAQYFSAHTEYRMFFDGECRGSVNAEYV